MEAAEVFWNRYQQMYLADVLADVLAGVLAEVFCNRYRQMYHFEIDISRCISKTDWNDSAISVKGSGYKHSELSVVDSSDENDQLRPDPNNNAILEG